MKQYFIEDKKTHLWWYPKYIENIEQDFNWITKEGGVHCFDPNKKFFEFPSKYRFYDGWTSDPNHPDIGYSNIESAESVMKIFGLSKTEFEITEHLFI